MKREIEVKIKLTKSDKNLLEKWLKTNAKFVKEENHLEYYLNNPNNSTKFIHKEGFIDFEIYFRVRFHKDNKAQINLKKFKIDQINGKAENIGEIEFNSDNAQNSLEFFTTLGYIDQTIIKKHRDIYIFSDFEIVIDNVEGLGYFAEFELKNFDDSLETKKLFDEVFDFIKKIGFKNILVQKRGYVSMLLNPQVDFTKKKTL